MLYYERKLRKQGYQCIIGVDEAGRGCLAGPVVAAAVVLGTSTFKNRIDDSKKLTPSQREKAYLEILTHATTAVGVMDEKTIDRVNILVATRMAMEQALDNLLGKLKGRPDQLIHIIVDGPMAVDVGLPCTAIIGGDAKSKSIAAASIVAKVTRDRMMHQFHIRYPQYGFSAHKGYGTIAHRVAIAQFGLCDIHRKTFRSD